MVCNCSKTVWKYIGHLDSCDMSDNSDSNDSSDSINSRQKKKTFLEDSATVCNGNYLG